MFADEPTGNLDSTTSGEILALLRKSVDALGQTTVMVTHDAHAAAIADRVLFLADGDIVRDIGPSSAHEHPRDARGGERPMIAVALKGLAARKVRALLTAFAVVIGVSMVSGTFILTDTMQKTFDGLFAASYDETDAVIAGQADRGEVHQRLGDHPRRRCSPRCARCPRSRRPAARSRRPRSTPPTSSAATARPSPRRASARASTPPTRASARSSSRPATGREGPEQVVVDAGTAGEAALRGRRHACSVATPGKTASYRITGTASYGDVDSLGFGSIAIWDLETAQALLDREGRFDTISIAAKDGTSPAELVARRAAARPRPRSR